MFIPSNTLIQSLRSYGLDIDEAKIYLYINKYGASTALKLSKELHIDRARVYRLLDKLIEKQLGVQKLGERGFTFDVAESKQFNYLLSEKEVELNSLKTELPLLLEQLKEDRSDNATDSGVKYYRGKQGLKQITWNSLKANKKLRILEVNPEMSAFMDKKLAEETRREFVKRRIHIKQLTNLKETLDFTEVKDVTKYWELRHVDKKLLSIDSEMLIYNDVVALYNVRGKDIFCVEIHDKRLAGMQKQIFDFIWNQSLQMKLIGEKGKALLEA
jgi:sugar-specific transcriptional regulator TrmB